MFKDLKLTYSYILNIQNPEGRNYISKAIDFFIHIINDDVSIEFKNFSEIIISELKKELYNKCNFDIYKKNPIYYSNRYNTFLKNWVIKRFSINFQKITDKYKKTKYLNFNSILYDKKILLNF